MRDLPILTVILAAILACATPVAAQNDVESADTAAKLDRVDLEDGSVIVGQIKSMVGGTLTVGTAFGGEVSIKWSEVKAVHSVNTNKFVLENGTAVDGSSQPADGGKLVLSSAGKEVEGSHTVGLDQVTAINPPAVKPVTYRGNLNLGINVTDGNTQTKNGSLNADFEARSKRHRVTAGAGYNYSEQGGVITARNAKARLKHDFFATERFFVYAGVLFEEDRFQDLNLRTAVSAGPGYQLIQASDTEDDALSKLEAYGEIGLSFFDEDFRTAMDKRYLAARWSFVANWSISDTTTLFHRHEGYPGLERAGDLYVTSEQGVRFNIWENFIATLQLNYRWDNTPSPGFERSDTQYLATLGYAFDL